MRILQHCGIGLIVVLLLSTIAAPPVQALTASPAALTFSALKGGSNPPSQIVVLSKGNKREAGWTGSDSATWLNVSPTSGQLTRSDQIVVTVNISGLNAGVYTGMVKITATKGGAVNIPVTLSITASSTTPPPSGYTLSGSSSVAPGQPLLINWTAPSGHSALDWLTIVLQGSGGQSFDYGRWMYLGAGTSGSVTWTAPAAAGSYEVRCFKNDGWESCGLYSVSVTATSSSSPPPAGGSTSAMLTWSPNADVDLAGYKIHFGNAPGIYGVPIDVGNVTSYVVSNLTLGNTYYFAVSAYDKNGNESGLSTVVSKSIY